MVLKVKNNPVDLFPVEIKEDIADKGIDVDKIREIRLRNGMKIMVITDECERTLDFSANSKLINLILENATGHSLYAYEDALKNGYITIEGGHRIGVTGQAVLCDKSIKTIKNISSLNIRFSRQVFGCADEIVNKIVSKNTIKNVLVISPPGYGKTTILRELVRKFSGLEINNHKINISVVDERGELAAMHKGYPYNDLGSHTDILEGCSKCQGMMMLIRTMTPDIVCIDEIGLEEDVEALRYVVNCGCNIFASIHGSSMDEVKKRPVIAKIFDEKIFDIYVFLKEKAGRKILIYDNEFRQID